MLQHPELMYACGALSAASSIPSITQVIFPALGVRLIGRHTDMMGKGMYQELNSFSRSSDSLIGTNIP